MTEEKVTVVSVEEEEEALTPVGASIGVVVTAGDDGDDVVFVPFATTTIE
jgi:hypothetical protein